jgi:RNA polymerase sigma-70 factor (ECF subfamily)
MYKDHETPRFWLSYGDALRQYLNKRLQDKTLMEDILHDVYVKVYLYCKRHQFCCQKAGVRNLRSWIFQVCHNTMIDRLKQDAKYRLTDDRLPEFPGNSCQNDEFSFFNAGELISLLPHKYAEAVYLDTILKTNQAEIASRLGLGISATKSRIQRGKKMLKEIYVSRYGRS